MLFLHSSSPQHILWPASGLCCFFWEAVGFVRAEVALPSQSPLEVCLTLIGRGGKRFSFLCLTLFYFEAIKHRSPGFVCLSNLGASRGNMMKQVFKAIKEQAGAQAELSIIARSTWRHERTVWVLSTFSTAGTAEGLSGHSFVFLF